MDEAQLRYALDDRLSLTKHQFKALSTFNYEAEDADQVSDDVIEVRWRFKESIRTAGWSYIGPLGQHLASIEIRDSDRIEKQWPMKAKLPEYVVRWRDDAPIPHYLGPMFEHEQVFEHEVVLGDPPLANEKGARGFARARAREAAEKGSA